jgi:hypothetical protein
VNPSAAEARSRPVPLWRWATWWALLGLAIVVFYVLLTPLWLGQRALAWAVEFRSRGRHQDK